MSITRRLVCALVLPLLGSCGPYSYDVLLETTSECGEQASLLRVGTPATNPFIYCIVLGEQPLDEFAYRDWVWRNASGLPVVDLKWKQCGELEVVVPARLALASGTEPDFSDRIQYIQSRPSTVQVETRVVDGVRELSWRVYEYPDDQPRYRRP
ncbi:MAG: hypothetical protein K8J08_22675 [Thermoanaerobaculia bacterium]|nr:hypothetical protein [Thermoanaerobaculia bacterium]